MEIKARKNPVKNATTGKLCKTSSNGIRIFSMVLLLAMLDTSRLMLPVPAKLARVSLVLKPAEADQADELIQESPSENDQLEISFN